MVLGSEVHCTLHRNDLLFVGGDANALRVGGPRVRVVPDFHQHHSARTALTSSASPRPLVREMWHANAFGEGGTKREL